MGRNGAGGKWKGRKAHMRMDTKWANEYKGEIGRMGKWVERENR